MDTLITLSDEALNTEILFCERALPLQRRLVEGTEQQLRELQAEKAKRLDRGVAA